MRNRILMAGSVMLLGACTLSGAPTERMAVARNAVANAEAAGAAERAPVEFERARGRLERAEAAMRRRRYVEAEQFADEAAIDARLAIIRANSAAAGVYAPSEAGAAR